MPLCLMLPGIKAPEHHRNGMESWMALLPGRVALIPGLLVQRNLWNITLPIKGQQTKLVLLANPNQ